MRSSTCSPAASIRGFDPGPDHAGAACPGYILRGRLLRVEVAAGFVFVLAIVVSLRRVQPVCASKCIPDGIPDKVGRVRGQTPTLGKRKRPASLSGPRSNTHLYWISQTSQLRCRAAPISASLLDLPDLPIEVPGYSDQRSCNWFAQAG